MSYTELSAKYPGVINMKLLESMNVSSAIMLNQSNKEVNHLLGIGVELPEKEVRAHSSVKMIYKLYLQFRSKVRGSRESEPICKLATQYIHDQLNHLSVHWKSKIGKASIEVAKDYVSELIEMASLRYLAISEEEKTITKALAFMLSMREEKSGSFKGGLVIIKVVSRRLVIINYDGDEFLLSQEQLKMVRTKVRESCILVLLSNALDNQALRKGFSECIENLIDEMYRLTVSLSDDICTSPFSIVEQIINGQLAMIADRRNFLNDGYLLTMYDELREIRPSEPDDFKESRLYEIIHEMTAPELIEATGIAKVLGFGVIDVDKTFEKVKGRLSQEARVDPQALQEFLSFIRHHFCRNYFYRYKKWPKVDLSRVTVPGIPEAVMRNCWVTDSRIINRYGRVTWADFGDVQFVETIAWDPYVEALELAKDTSISPKKRRLLEYAQDLEGMYAAEQLSQQALVEATNKAKQSRLKPEDKSLLAAMLFTRDLNDLLLDSNEAFYLSDLSTISEYLCQKLVPKSGELKTQKGRLFGMMSMELRHKRSVDQANAKKIDKLWAPLNVKTASDSEIIEAMNKLSFFRRVLDKRDNRINFVITVDAEAWCNSHSVNLFDEGIGRVFDEIFGHTSYRNMMKEFGVEVKVLTADGKVHYYGKSIDPEELYYNVVEGNGIEGQQQSIWGNGYGSVISFCLRDMEEVIEINNGDNASALCSADRASINPGETDKDYMYRRVREFKDQMSKFGYKVKLEETMVTQDLLVMCKRYIERGRLIGTGLKKGIKMANEPEASLMTLETRVASMGSTLHSSCYQGLSHLGFYTIYVYRLIQLFSSVLLSTDQLALSKLLYRPVQFGGFAVMLFIDTLTRGVVDSVSRQLSFLKFCYEKGSSQSSTVARYILTHTPLEKKGEPSIIAVRNPVGLPVLRPRSAAQVVTAEMVTTMKDSRNTRIRTLARLKDNDMRTRSYDTLTNLALSIRPFSQRVAYAIASCGEVSLVDQIISKFTKSRTLIGVFILMGYKRSKVDRIMRAVHYADLRFLEFLLETPGGLIDVSDDCAAINAHNLRKECYGDDITFDSYPCTTEAFQWIDGAGKVDDYPYAPGFILSVKDQVDPREIKPHYEVLNRKVGLEKKTRGKLDIQIPDFCEGNKKFDSIRDLLTIIGHLGIKNKPLRDFLISYVRVQCPFIMDQLKDMIPQKISGTLRHRLSIHGDDLLSGFNAIAGVVTNMLKELRRATAFPTLGDTSTNLIHDECFATMCICILFMTDYHPDLPKTMDMRFTLSRCKGCLHEVNDPVFTFEPQDLEETIAFEEPHIKEVLFVRKSIESATENKHFRSLSSYTSPQVIQAARSIVAMAYARPHRSLARELAAVEGHRGLNSEEFDTIEEAYGISTINISFSLNDLRALPSADLLKEIVSTSLYWVISMKRFKISDVASDLVRSIDVFDLPFRNLARELIDSTYLPVIALAITSMGLNPPSTGECVRLESCQRYLLKAGLQIVADYLSDNSHQHIFPSPSEGLPHSPDDSTASSRIVDHFNLIAVRVGHTIIRKWLRERKLTLVNLIRCLRQMESNTVFQVNVESYDHLMLVPVSNRFVATNNLPVKAKHLDPVVKTLISSSTDEEWYKLPFQRAIQLGPIFINDPLSRIVADISQATLVSIFTMRIEDALAINRANPGLEFRTFLATLMSFDNTPTRHLSNPVTCKNLRQTRPLDLKFSNGLDFKNFIIRPKDHHSSHNINVSNFNRPLGEEVTSANKFLDVLFFHDCLSGQRSTYPLCTTGEGSGGVTTLLLQLFKGNVLFNTLVTDDTPNIPTVVMSAGLASRITAISSYAIPSDLTEKETVEALVSLAISKGMTRIVLFTMDAESATGPDRLRQGLKILENIIWMMTMIGHPLSVLIFKVSSSDEELLNILSLAFFSFKEMNLTRSNATHSDSNEFFIVAREPIPSQFNQIAGKPYFQFLKNAERTQVLKWYRYATTFITGPNFTLRRLRGNPRIYVAMWAGLSFSFLKTFRAITHLELTYNDAKSLLNNPHNRRNFGNMVNDTHQRVLTASKTVFRILSTLVDYYVSPIIVRTVQGNSTVAQLRAINVDTEAQGVIARLKASPLLLRKDILYGQFSVKGRFTAEIDIRRKVAQSANSSLRFLGCMDIIKRSGQGTVIPDRIC